MKVVYLAFANSQADPLPTLAREDEGVYGALINRSLKGNYLIHRDSYSTLEKMNEYLGKFDDNLAVFLYSGHAGKNALLLDDEIANAAGIAHQLGKSARKGNLKLVVLNGCSTAGQVKRLLNEGIPVVVATHAPVNDKSATEFSLRFFRNLSENRMSIKDAFYDALGPAQTATERDLSIAEKKPRDINFIEKTENGTALWDLFSNSPDALDVNPIPVADTRTSNSRFEPNEQLTKVLYDALAKAGNKNILELVQKENEGNEGVEIAEKQTRIVNNLPFPIAIHLQKLLCPTPDEENEGWDKVDHRRLEQIGMTFHVCVEFVGFILLSQLWEMKVTGVIKDIPLPLLQMLKDYFYLPFTERTVFNYLPLIKSIRELFDDLSGESRIPFFVNELQDEELTSINGSYYQACIYLTQLRKQTFVGTISESDAQVMCEEAESKLCDFFARLGFMHKYSLTSIQNIDIQKYRHQSSSTFSHQAVKLMRAIGKPEQNYYILSRFLDNRGIMLIKGDIKLDDQKRKRYKGEDIAFLNLTPFVIDQNAFSPNSDLSKPLFFGQYNKLNGAYEFKSVKRPKSERDQLTVGSQDEFEALRLQLEAFRIGILNDNS